MGYFEMAINLDFLEFVHFTKILVVEDDAYLHSFLQQSLHEIQASLQIIWVKKAEEAWGLIEKEKFDLIISDYHLKTEKTGLDLMTCCRAGVPQIPFLLLSSRKLSK